MKKVFLREELDDYTDVINPSVLTYLKEGQVETFEGFQDYDLIGFDWYDIWGDVETTGQILIYLDAKDLFFICENDDSYRAALRLYVPGHPNNQTICLFFRGLFKGTIELMEGIESEISRLDDDIADGTEPKLLDSIHDMRDRVMVINKYFRQLSLVLDDVCENENGLIDDRTLQFLGALRNRAEHVLSLSQYLRDYVSQIRDAYSAQIAIEQNNFMRVFTIVTSISMPLTLIVGWYGMNLRMPEFQWAHGYQFVIVLSIVVCVAWVGFFKKRGWFD